MKRAGLFLAVAICEQSDKETTAGVIANTLGQQSNDMRASLASRGQMLFRVTKRLLCPMLVLFCVAFFAQNAQGQCTSLSSGNWNVGTNWSCGHQPTSADGAITVVSGHTMTVTAAVTVDQVTVNSGGQITISNGVTLTLANPGAGDDLIVNGTLSVQGSISMNTTAAINIAGTAVVEDAAGGGPGAIFANDQNNVITIAVGGQLTVRSPGNASSAQGVRLVDGNGGDQLIVNGTLTVVDGTVLTQHTDSFVVAGSASFSGASTLTTTVGSGITVANINSGGTLSFSGTSQWSIGTVATANGSLNSGGTLDIGPSAFLTGAGKLNVNTGGTLKIGSTDGINTSTTMGNVRTTATDSYATDANYTYDGTAPQVTGIALPATVNNFTVNNPAGVTQTVATTLTVNGTATLTNGTYTLTTLTMGNGTTISRDVGTLSAAPTFGASVNVTYTGTTGVTSGPEIPAAVGVLSNLTINKTGGVTLGASLTVNGVLALNSGDITTGANTLNMALAATSSASPLPGFDVVGNVNRTNAFATNTAYAFGNQFNTISFTAAGTKPTAMTVNLVKAAPNDFSNAVKRTYSITNTGGTSFSATLQLHYLDSELNGNTETSPSLQLWKKSGTWGALGATGTNTTDNWVQLSGVSSFSLWAISGPNAPTDVAMVNLKATRYDNRVLLEWQTGYEINNIGFNIYREENGKLAKVTPEPVAGSALIFGPRVALRAGFAYSWWDNDARDGDNTRYWLEDLDLSGRTAMRGPFFVDRPLPGVKPPSSDKATAPPLSAIGKDASALGSSAPVERRAKILKPTAAGLSVQQGLASHQAVKLSVKHEGWYRVEQADLVAAGVPADVEHRLLMLFADGLEVPIIVTGTGAAPAKGIKKPGSIWDGIEFYGIGIDSAFTDSHVYWLVVGADPGLRIDVNPGSGGAPAPSTFPYAVERRDKVVYFPSLKNGGGEKFYGPLVYNAQAVDQSVVLQHIGTTGLATLDVSLQGFTNAPHSVRVVLNGTDVGLVQFNGLSKGTAQYSVPQSSLLEGSNQVQLISLSSGFGDISMVEYVRVTYQHTNTADGNALKFPATGGQQTTIGGFTSSAVRVMDTTNANSPQELNVTVGPDGAGFSATVTAPGSGVRTLLAFAADQKKPAAAIVANQPSSWRTPANAADYVAVTRQDLLSSLVPLVKQRVKQGLKTSVVDIEDLYDEFSFGNKTPQALKDFFSYTKTDWKRAPRFALLAGDATYDPKNYLGVGDFDLVPTKLVETAFNETATDDWFVDVNGDSVPDIAIGRLPVRTAQETAALVSKIIGYDQSEASEGVVLVADRNAGFDFEGADTQLQGLIPANLRVTDIRRAQLGDSNARSQLLDALNHGAKLVNYYGHGSTRLWTDAPLLTAADAPSLGNTERLALFDAMTCLNGFFHDPTIESLGEALLKSEGGAIAVWVSSGMTDPSAQVVMNQQAIQLLFSGSGLTIGEVTAQAKAATGNADVRRTWVLLGDPATKIK